MQINFSQNNLLKYLITICIRRYYNLRIFTSIANCCSPYYKMRRLDLLQKCCTLYYTMRTLLQNAAILITKCVTYYKIRRYYKMPQNKPSRQDDTVAKDCFIGKNFPKVKNVPTRTRITRKPMLKTSKEDFSVPRISGPVRLKDLTRLET